MDASIPLVILSVSPQFVDIQEFQLSRKSYQCCKISKFSQVGARKVFWLWIWPVILMVEYEHILVATPIIL
jgi:hypothetical protein